MLSPVRRNLKLKLQTKVVQEVVMNGQNQELVQRVGNERLAAVGECFASPELNHVFHHATPGGG